MATAAEKLFRKAALDRISSPEQLDRAVTVADARSWIAATGLGLGLVFLLVWGIFGSIPTNVPAKGILIPQDGRVVSAMSPAGGVVDRILVSVGDTVVKGQVVARIRQDESRQRLGHARQVMSEKSDDQRSRRTVLQQELQATLTTIGQRQTALEQSAAAARDRIRYLEQQVRNRQEMLAMGFATAETIQTAQNELSRARRELADSHAQISAAKAEAMQARLNTDREMRQLAENVANAGRRAEELSTEISLSSEVLAPSAGRVNEIRLTEGVVVATGQPVLGIESAGSRLQAVVYIPTEHGKKVHAGMLARVAPSTVKKEESGTLTGAVAQVSPFPATRQGITAVVQNETLIEDFVKKGAPYEARIDLVPADTPSGYGWSSGHGPDIDLSSGTTVDVSIAVREQRPISLILPFLRRAVGVDR
ncbi:NHLP bacteriocin system secretion protein [Magnetospirillum sulfuroxidans]|uniref:NHLP bacteriocin system secretion protein n=1 Tax=Magnetospirillum sulfuroxidans TaxID=611300 RepID=A0ABS5IDR3_9PROT|nr:NHLP bacteriocin system secretion protein [Magnetospirillum sulfuroxidans]MBR9972540.1 NHLP bacteriocin system secretion protein [Magnetospirillum sulfuroxidans]